MRTIHEAIAVSERDVLPCPCCGHGACHDENACMPHARTPRRAALRWLAAVFGTLLLALGFAAVHARAEEKLLGDSIYQLELPLVDQDGRAMFAEGSKEPLERTRKLIEKLAPALARMPNRIRIIGHTATTRGGSARPASGAWLLSTERALAVRDILAGAGIGDDRFHSVVGRADTDPLFPDDPTTAANRRVTILLMREEPPMPRGAKP